MHVFMGVFVFFFLFFFGGGRGGVGECSLNNIAMKMLAVFILSPLW